MIPATTTRNDDETDEEIRARMAKQFEILGKLTLAVARNTLKGLIVYGAAGVGKSFEATKALSSASNADTYNIYKGSMTAAGLYAVLYKHRAATDIIVFDDCDAVLHDENSIAYLKAALDTTSEREIGRGSAGKDDLPQKFVFEASIIFITNTDFVKAANSNGKLAPHIEAIMSRCLYLDLMVDTDREKLLRIDYVARDLGMLDRELSDEPDGVHPFEVEFIREELLEWLHKNQHNFRELSLRKLVHLAALRKSNSDWQELAEATILENM